MLPPQKNYLPWLAALCAVLSGVLIFWSRRSTPELHSWQAMEQAEPNRAALSGTVEAIPAATQIPAPGMAAPTGPSAPQTTPPPAETTGSGSAAAPTPAPTLSGSAAVSGTGVQPRPTDAELAGPLPAKTPENTVAAVPAPDAAAVVSATAAPTTGTAPQTPGPAIENLASIPLPTPAPDAAGISGQPQFWPRSVALVVPVTFPAIIKGAPAGSFQAPRGMVVTLKKVNADGTVEVERQGATVKIPGESTDLLIRVQAAAAIPNPPGALMPETGASAPKPSTTGPAPTPTPVPE